MNQETLIKKATYLRIAAFELAEGMKNGNFRSLYRGQGIEFSGVRDYMRGDDIRSIDWNVTARMGRPYVKVFEEERELQIFLVVDSSASMQLENDRRSKYTAASEAAALVTIAAELNGCSVGAVMFDGEIHFSCKPQPGREQTMLLLTHLDKLPQKRVNGSVLGSALTGAGRLLKKRSLILVLSDFRTGNWEEPLISLSQKHDVVALRITDSYDELLPEIGTVYFKDAESDASMLLPSSSAKFKKAWGAHYDSSIKLWRDACLKHGIYPAILKTNAEPLEVLTNIFSRKAGN